MMQTDGLKQLSRKDDLTLTSLSLSGKENHGCKCHFC